MQFIDLSHTISSGMPVFPGSAEVKTEITAFLESHRYNEKLLHLSTHTGTHIDCAKHLVKHGFDTAGALPEKFYGRGIVIDCRDEIKNGIINVSCVRKYENEIRHTDFVLFYTGWYHHWGTSVYTGNSPVPGTDIANYLAGFKLKGAGIDTMSMDNINSFDLPVHHILLSREMVLVENLTNLESLPVSGFHFCCFPLKIEDGDGSPVRAIGLINNTT